MGIEDRRAREQAERRRLIVTTARRLAEADGWDAVTTRRLSTEIEYSQPVLYKHFTGMEQIADAVALDGFAELAEAMRRVDDSAREDALTRIAHAYLAFAQANPAVYEAMFSRASGLRFAADDTPPELSAAFAVLRDAVSHSARGLDPDTMTELFWAALHGVVTLGRTGRLRPDHDDERVRLLVERFGG
ncbi:transcriptional regulator [Mycolicibacterium rhodesiae NBB3]|jgi:AcrR family transcriptional regulator|uniref:Transcriptional regulator n=1 Tax=Mycolicibacterium rhodesiae (strain NBB3) TaxID=710685 RepID=G8RLA8_MYCRN|nr:TetR/AcrR family transcriptional regulator [Mycolicibacterium rhodesiae]AEV72370.1 transcriptional regulator [Mycolicibacterium rhodesiae NBB3]